MVKTLINIPDWVRVEAVKMQNFNITHDKKHPVDLRFLATLSIILSHAVHELAKEPNPETKVLGYLETLQKERKTNTEEFRVSTKKDDSSPWW